MNSNSRYFNNDDDCRKERHQPQQQTIIKCGTPGAVTIPLATVIGTTFTPSSLALNTERLCNPCTKLEFTSNIIATAFTGSLTFQVFKQCNNQFTPVPVGPAFTYERLVAVTESGTFTFFICDCDSCNNECCTYTVVITVNAITVGVLNINNATLGAISTSQVNTCC